MNFIDFPQRNELLAKDQPEYQTIPVFVDKRLIKTEDGPKEIPWSMTCVYEFTEEEIAEIIATRKLFYRQMLFGHHFQPIFLSTKDPFIPENKQHWPAE